jgi:hypothetical protein
MVRLPSPGLLLSSLAIPLASFAGLGCSGAVEPSTGSQGSGQQGHLGGGNGNQSSADAGGGGHDSGPPPVTCVPGSVQTCLTGEGTTTSVQTCTEDANGQTGWGACDGPTSCATPQSCTTASGQPGASCDGAACVAIGSCDPTAGAPTGGFCMECPCYCLVSDGAWQTVTPPCNTPLVLAFGGERVEFTRASGSFDVVGGEASVDTDWVSAATPWLAIDLDGDGAVDDGRELFGSMTVLPDGTRARNGFEALVALDDDGDGRITASDPAFARLLVWRDRDQDRRSSARELQSASDAGLVAIELGYRDVPMCRGGSCEVERAHFVFRDARGRERRGDVVDVHLATR